VCVLVCLDFCVWGRGVFRIDGLMNWGVMNRWCLELSGAYNSKVFRAELLTVLLVTCDVKYT
jgi:hypothetical protein